MKLQSIEYADVDTSKIPAMGKNLDTIFCYNSDTHKTAYMNWRTRLVDTPRRQFVVLGEAYFSSAYSLIQQCLNDNNDYKADALIFPIMFDIVHGMEVYLKAINAVLSVELKKERGITEGGHDLKALCATARKLIIEYKLKNKNTTTDQMFLGIKVVERFVANIYDKTEDMTFARYPMTKDKNGHFYIETFENEVVDMELLAEQIVYVYKMLDFIFETQEMNLEIREEMSEMESYY